MKREGAATSRWNVDVICFLNQLGEVVQQLGEIVQQALDMPAATPLRKEETPSPLRGQLGIVMHILLHCSVRDVFDLRANLNEHTPVVSGKLGWELDGLPGIEKNGRRLLAGRELWFWRHIDNYSRHYY